MTITISPDQNHAECDGVKLKAVDWISCSQCFGYTRNCCGELPCEIQTRRDGQDKVWIRDKSNPSELLAVAREMLGRIAEDHDATDRELIDRARRVIEAQEDGV